MVSDLHLGHPSALVGSVEWLRPLLAGARTVVFNGDTCELAHAPWRASAEELLGLLRNLCDELGVHPVFLTGNHDYDISERGWLELRDGAVMVTHGDLLVPEVAPWNHQYLLKKREVREVLRRRSGDGKRLEYRWETVRMVEEILKSGADWKPVRTGLLRYWKALWPPERIVGILQGWWTMFGAAEQFVEHYRPEAKVFIFGHFHRAGIRMRGSRLYCNTGAYMREARQMVVDLDGNWLTARPVVRNGEVLGLGPPAGVWRLADSDSD